MLTNKDKKAVLDKVASETQDFRILEGTPTPSVIVRHPDSGTWNGYVSIPEGHRYHGKDIRDWVAQVTECGNIVTRTMGEAFTVHFGVSYSGGDLPTFSYDIDIEGNWWIGFDCNHYTDLAPNYIHGEVSDYVYRTEEFAEEHTRSLSEQVAAVESNLEEAYGGPLTENVLLHMVRDDEENEFLTVIKSGDTGMLKTTRAGKVTGHVMLTQDEAAWLEAVMSALQEDDR